MKDVWRYWFVGFQFLLIGGAMILLHITGMPVIGLVLFGMWSYMFIGICLYIGMVDIIPFSQSWKLILCWLPSLFSENVLSWMTRKF